MDEDELANLYRAEAAQSQEEEAAKRIAESADPALDERLRATPLKELIDSDELVAAIIARLGMVRAALEGHGGAIKVEHISEEELGVDLILNLDGACIACGAAPGTLQGIQADLLATGEVWRIRFSESLLDTFDEWARIRPQVWERDICLSMESNRLDSHRHLWLGPILHFRDPLPSTTGFGITCTCVDAEPQRSPVFKFVSTCGYLADFFPRTT